MVLADLLVTGAVLVLLFTLQPHSGQGVLLWVVICHVRVCSWSQLCLQPLTYQHQQLLQRCCDTCWALAMMMTTISTPSFTSGSLF